MSQPLPTLNWSREQIAVAFQIEGTLTAENHNYNDPQKSFRAMHELRGNGSDIAFVRVTTFARHVRFKIATVDGYKTGGPLFVHCTKAGAVDYVEGHQSFVKRAARALVCLNIDIAVLEQFGNFITSYHQRLEWLLEFEAQLKALEAPEAD